MRSRAVRALRRVVLVVPLVLAALGLLLLPRPPPLPLPAKHDDLLPSPPPPPPHPPQQQIVQNLVIEEVELPKEEDEVSRRPWFMRGGKRRPQHHDPQAKVFPEDAPGDDRIVEQLMYTLPKDRTVPIKNIFLANGFGPWNVSPGRKEFLKNNCPVDSCSLTADTRDAATADAVLFKDHFTTMYHKRTPQQIWILYYLECPYHTPKLRPWSSFDVFNWTSTYRRDSDIVAPYEKFVYHDPQVTERELDKNYAANKTKKVAWFVSNCHAVNRRLEYAMNLSKHIQVDIYGACGGGHFCVRDDPNCLHKLDKEYKFYLSFENSNCRDYVTEKLFVNGLSHDVIPIVMGARPSEYAAVAPPNSYIHVEEFANPEELATYLHMLDKDDTLYNSYFKWKGTGEFINTFFFCRVCAMLHASEQRNRMSHYSDVEAWWRQGTCTRGEWRDQKDPNKEADKQNTITKEAAT